MPKIQVCSCRYYHPRGSWLLRPYPCEFCLPSEDWGGGEGVGEDSGKERNSVLKLL